MSYIIYMVTNLIDNKSYIGQTVRSLKRRKQAHISESNLKRDSYHFHQALFKYGHNNFKWEIIDTCKTIKKLNELEIFYIGYYDTYNNGYNLTTGGNGKKGWIITEKARQNFSSANSGKNNPRYGVIVSEETRQKISNALMGIRPSKETRQKISKAKKGKFCGKNSSRAKAVIYNGKLYESMTELAKELQVHPTTIANRIKVNKSGYEYD